MIVIGIIIGGIVGWVACYFVMRNNPKYFNIDRMAKERLRDLKAKIEAKL